VSNFESGTFRVRSKSAGDRMIANWNLRRTGSAARTGQKLTIHLRKLVGLLTVHGKCDWGVVNGNNDRYTASLRDVCMCVVYWVAACCSKYSKVAR
jgi:hypothetical protein